MKLYKEEQVKQIQQAILCNHKDAIMDDNYCLNVTKPIELPSDEDMESKYNKFIDAEIQLGFLKQEQGERLKWYYKTYFIDKIGGNNEQQ
jgi:hypothetical protein